MAAERHLSGSPRRPGRGPVAACAALAALALVLLPPALAGARPASPLAHAAAKQRACKNPKPKTPSAKPPVFIRASGLSCASATALAVKVAATAPAGCVEHTDARHVRLRRPCRVAGYGCTDRRIVGGMALEATCRHGAKAVRFQAQS